MLSVDFWLEQAETKTTKELIEAIQQDALTSCRIIAGQKWRLNNNGQWQAACLTVIKAIKTLEGVQEVEE